MSYLYYMTSHYQNAINDHVNGTRATNIFNITDIRNHPQNVRPQKMKGNMRSQEHILFFGP